MLNLANPNGAKPASTDFTGAFLDTKDEVSDSLERGLQGSLSREGADASQES